MSDPDNAKGAALCIGITEYADSELSPLPAVAEEVSIVKRALEESGFISAESLVGACTRAEIANRLRAVKVPRSGRLLLYWTGHGLTRADGSYLLTSESTLDQLNDSTCMTPGGLSDVLRSVPGASQIVVILDCCAAGTAAVDVANAINLSRDITPVGRGRPATISLIAATFGTSNVNQLQFADALSSALRLGSPTLPWPAQLSEVTPQDLAVAADDWMFKHGEAADHARSIGIEAGTPFFRNPLYSPYAHDIQLGDTAMVRRDAVLTAVQSWRSHTVHGLFLIHGAMGTGKSTVMRQLNATSVVPATLYSIDLAPQRDLRHAVKVLAGPEAGSSTPSDVVTWLRAKEEPTVVLVDSLDEAAPTDRLAILTQVLLPLSASPGVHVVVAARHGVDDEAMAILGQAASGSVNLDTDRDAHEHITRHVLRILTTTPNSPYAEERELASLIAHEIADHTAGVFLFADRVANSLAREIRPLAPAAPEFQAILRSGIGGAIERDLAKVSDRPDLVLDVLTPLAFAAGAGLPRTHIWPALATALGTHRVTVEDVQRVLAIASSFVLAESEQGRIVYRLRHQTYQIFLRSRITLDAVTIQRRIVDALRVPPGRWSKADPYVLRYLAVHAEAAGRIDRLVEDNDFLVHADSRLLLPILSGAPTHRFSQNHTLYLMAGPLLHDCSPAARAFTMASLRVDTSQKRSWQPTIMPCAGRTVWTTSPIASPHRLIRIGAQHIEALSAAQVDGGWVLAAAISRDQIHVHGQGSGSIELWDPATARHIQTLRRKERSDVTFMTTVHMPSDSLVAVSYRDAVLEAWSLRQRSLEWSRDVNTLVTHLTAIRSRRQEVLLGIVSDGRVMLWEPRTGAPLYAFRPNGGAVFVIKFYLPDAAVLCFGTQTGVLHFYDADSLLSLGEIRPDETWVAGVATEVRGRPVLIGALQDGRLEMRDSRDGRLLRRTYDETDAFAESLTTAPRPGDDPYLVLADGDDLLFCDTSPFQLGKRIYGHVGDITAVEVLADAVGNHLLITAGADGTIREWSKAQSQPSVSVSSLHREAHEHYSDMWYLPSESAVLARRGSDYVFLDVADGTVRHFSPGARMTADGTYAHDLTDVVTLQGMAMLLTHHDGRAQHLWAVRESQHYSVPTDPYRPVDVVRVVVTRLNAPPVFVIGDGHTPLSVYEFGGKRIGILPESDGGLPLSAVSAGGSDGVLVRLGDTVYLYNIENGTRSEAFPIEPTSWGQRRATLLTATCSLDGKTVTTVVRSHDGTAYLQEIGKPLDRRKLALDLSSATALTVGGVPMLALADGHRILLLHPDDGEIVETLPMEGRISKLVAAEDSQILVLVGGCLRLLALEASLSRR